MDNTRYTCLRLAVGFHSWPARWEVELTTYDSLGKHWFTLAAWELDSGVMPTQTREEVVQTLDDYLGALVASVGDQQELPFP